MHAARRQTFFAPLSLRKSLCSKNWGCQMLKFPNLRYFMRKQNSHEINGFKIGCNSTLAFFVSGTERTPNGSRTDPERSPNGLQTDSKRIQNGLRTNPKRIPNGPRTDSQRTPNGPQTDPKRTPHGSRTDSERTPNGPRARVRKIGRYVSGHGDILCCRTRTTHLIELCGDPMQIKGTPLLAN